MLQDKCGGRLKEIWPYIRQEIKPTLDDLGILTPEEMGYDKPELALKDVMDM
jgi:cytochrome c oxidase subunit 5a